MASVTHPTSSGSLSFGVRSQDNQTPLETARHHCVERGFGLVLSRFVLPDLGRVTYLVSLHVLVCTWEMTVLILQSPGDNARQPGRAPGGLEGIAAMNVRRYLAHFGEHGRCSVTVSSWNDWSLRPGRPP